MGRILSGNRYATVTSTLALIIALGGGTAYAADLITSRDIKNGGVKRIDIARGAINSGKVADGTLLKGDFKAGQLPAGPRGPAGAQGPAGPAGPAGAAGPVGLRYVGSGPYGVAPGEQDGVDVPCPQGMSVVGGGVYNGSTDLGVTVNMSAPFDGDDADIAADDGWSAYLNNQSAEYVGFQVWAICTSATSVSFSHMFGS